MPQHVLAGDIAAAAAAVAGTAVPQPGGGVGQVRAHVREMRGALQGCGLWHMSSWWSEALASRPA